MLHEWFRTNFQRVVQEDRTFAENGLVPIVRPMTAYAGNKRNRKLTVAGTMRGGCIEERAKIPYRKHMKFPTLKCEGEDELEAKRRYPYRRKPTIGLDWWLRLVPWGGYYPTKEELETMTPILEKHANPRFLEWAMGFPQKWTEI